MFDAPHEHQFGNSLTGELIDLYDEFTEFNDYCSFLCDAFACVVAQEEVLDNEKLEAEKEHLIELLKKAGIEPDL